MKNRNFIRTLSTAGVSTFLIVGLSGCNNNTSPECKNISNLSQKKLEECQKSSSSGYASTAYYATKTSGYFGNGLSSSSNYGG